MTKRLTIKELEAKTNGSYSYDRYTASGWRGTIRFLYSECRYDDHTIVAIMLSKYTRWAADGSSRPYGQVNSDAMRAFMIQCPTLFTDKALKELCDGTPF